VIADKATLAWVASIVALEIHPFLHRASKLDTPATVVFDLDPGEGSDILTCARVAFILKDVLDRLELQAFAKVSGSKGLQIHVPLNTPVSYAITQRFARSVAELLAQDHPKLVVAEMAKAMRAKKVFIDWSQNADHKTTVAVYSLRAKRHRPYVSMPVDWDELQRALDAKDVESLYFLPAAAIVRLAKVGDLFAPVLTLEQRLPDAFGQGAKVQPARRPRSLDTYAEKRHFEQTPEPRPAPVPRRSRQGGRRRFVIQKHEASHLHFDLRLESQDVLRSWSVPKGMPYALDERRLAIATEDHPLDYLTFEGIIPAGQYGGGTVMVWDIGTYDVIEGNYWKGMLRFFLTGTKLEGEWLLERDPAKGEKAWSLTKTGAAIDAAAAGPNDESALSGRTMSAIAAARDAEWQSNRAPAAVTRAAVHAAVRATDLRFVEPMLCELVERLPAGDDWQYEIKFDGYRALGIRGTTGTRLYSRRGNSLASRFAGVTAALSHLPANTMLDGEVVALDTDGRPSFALLHRGRTSADRIFYYAFDVLACAGQDVRNRPLAERRRLLETAVPETSGTLRRSVTLDADPAELVTAAREFGFEGIVAKRRDSVYEPGKRTGAWVKCRVSPGQELVIGGYLPDSRSSFDALLVGYYEGKRLLFIAKIRNGFVPATRRELLERLRALATDRCPFANLPEPRNARRGIALTAEVMKRCQWVKPTLVAQVEFTEWTQRDHLRHARFLGLRNDKDALEVTKEDAAARRDSA
jgi:bifunctional non-homologous end joining protein LigD